VFVTAIAIVDDLGAVLVIALFYTAEIAWSALAFAAVIIALLVLNNRVGIRSVTPYVLLGVLLWIAVRETGVHATIAGVLLAMTIPARRLIDAPEFLERTRLYIAEFAEDVRRERSELTADQRDAVHSLEVAAEHVQTPLIRLEHALHPWVAFFIMPVFAIANAGVALGGDISAVFGMSTTLGVILGLFVGKQIGIFFFSWLAVRAGIAVLPTGISWREVWGVGVLCGIGFTMSLFIATLAFTDPQLLDAAKIGILTASFASGVVGAWLLLRVRKTPTEAAGSS
jgi:NhaA family Na+:H+ antiporter